MSKSSSRKTATSTPILEMAQNVSKKLGINWVEPDDPIYNEPVTVSFISRSGKSTQGGKANSEKKSQPEEYHSDLDEIQNVINRRMRHGTSDTDSQSDGTDK